MKRIGVDVGGTFTDLIYVDDETGAVLVHKLPTTPDDPSQGTVAGIRELAERAGESPAALDQVFHGTTIATNIVIQHDGATVGMITTEGYRDILHIARHKKPLNFSNYQDLPWQAYPVVRRRHRLTVPERITKDGSVLVPLDEEKAREQVRKLKEAQVEAVAVCFLFSFLNPSHEQRVAEIVREEFPEAFLSVSSEVLPQYREYERFSTVGLNAFIGPKVGSYVNRLQEELTELGVRTGLHLMTSASGVATAEAAAKRPVNLLMSGPVAGVVGGIWAGRLAGHANVITLDVGGTSADIGLAQDGKLRMKHLLDTKVGPYQAMIPMVDVDTIGAGGGSIAYVDARRHLPGRAALRRCGAGPRRLRPRRHRADRDRRPGEPRLAAARGIPRRRYDAARGPGARGVRHRAGRVLGMSRRGGVDGRRADPLPLDGAVHRGELRAQGLRSEGLRARRRGRCRPAVGGQHRHRGGNAPRGRPTPPRHRGGDGAPGHRHDVRVRGDHVLNASERWTQAPCSGASRSSSSRR